MHSVAGRRETECITPRLPGWRETECITPGLPGWREMKCITPGLPRIQYWMKRNRMHHTWVTWMKRNGMHHTWVTWMKRNGMHHTWVTWMKRNGMHHTWVTWMKRNGMHHTWVTPDPVLDEEKRNASHLGYLDEEKWNASHLGYPGSSAGWRETECITPGLPRIQCWMKRNWMHHTWVTKHQMLDKEKWNAAHLCYRGSSAGWREAECITPVLPRFPCWMKRSGMHHTWVTEDPVLDEEKMNTSHLCYQGFSAGQRETECITPELPRIQCWMKRKWIHHTCATKDPVLDEEKMNTSHLCYQGSSAGWREAECITSVLPRIQYWMKGNGMHHTCATEDPVLDEEKMNTSKLCYQGSSARWREAECITSVLPRIQYWMKGNGMHHTYATKDPVLDEEKLNASHLCYRGSSAGWRETECITPVIQRIQCWMKWKGIHHICAIDDPVGSWIKRSRMHHTCVTKHQMLDKEKWNASHLCYWGSSAGWR